jgi:predicted nucleic acid-binding Zn ribbon protein
MAGRHPAAHTPFSRGAAPPVGALVPGVLARLGLAEGVERWRAVVEWEAIVGPSLARHSRAARVDGDTLIVETDDPYGLSHSKLGLLKLVREHLGSDCIRDLRLVIART